ncbi:type II toxin-antitoxin system Phd/YefM family antitoxin [Methylopila sp. M107]|uniref:type II toxin-antitoxin system Phd/YefM family antitoxin n=1 Tax=Methylopila sp. M107 TaxID=1101190 RepID=UPI000379963B|nr:type II toxin-antitoxin system Phd/YefM family antitoxin [Methylopila sp. M107]
MKELAFTEAKARLSEVVTDARNGEPTIITRHGKKIAVVTSYQEWKKATDKPSLWELLTSAPIDGRELRRNPSPMRKLDF